MVTMREVAERAGVSAKTVSRVLRNDRYVSDSVRERVNAAVDDLQYVPNMLAVTFRSGRDAAVGVAVPDIGDPFFAQIVQSVEAVARERETAVIVTSLGYDPEHERVAVDALLRRQVQGLICCPVSTDQSYLGPWLKRTPVVFVDRAPGRVAADCVIEDDLGGGELATGHLLHHGHRRIAFVGDAHRASTTMKRLEGSSTALAEAGIPWRGPCSASPPSTGRRPRSSRRTRGARWPCSPPCSASEAPVWRWSASGTSPWRVRCGRR
jgi:LacI family transcriptional regulator